MGVNDRNDAARRRRVVSLRFPQRSTWHHLTTTPEAACAWTLNPKHLGVRIGFESTGVQCGCCVPSHIHRMTAVIARRHVGASSNSDPCVPGRRRDSQLPILPQARGQQLVQFRGPRLPGRLGCRCRSRADLGGSYPVSRQAWPRVPCSSERFPAVGRERLLAWPPFM